MANLKVEFTEHDLKKLVSEYISKKLGIDVAPIDLKFEVKTSQNYRTAEWEVGQFRLMVNKIV